MKKQTLISIENFEPAGPRDLEINSPRSLKACRKYEIDPSQLFIWTEEEFVQKIGEAGINTGNVEEAYEQYINEIHQIIENITALRQEIITNGGDEGKKKKKDHKTKSVKGVAKVWGEEEGGPRADRVGEDRGEEEEGNTQTLKSKNIGKKKGTKRKRPATAKLQQPSADVMREFQTTQYLPAVGGEREEEDRGGERSSKKDSIRRMQEAQMKELRRQENMVNSSNAVETKKQRLLNKILFDNIKAKRLKMEKEGMLELHKIRNGY